MKNFTNHFFKRWVERVVGIKTEREINEYINKNREKIIEHANKTFEYAEFIYTGQIGDNVTRNYYIKDSLIFVTNISDDAFISILRVDLGFTDELNLLVTKELIKEIKRLSEEKEEINSEISEEIGMKEYEILATEDKIEILQEQINNLKKEKAFKEEEVKQIKRKSLNIGLELKKHTLTLVNSKDYKSDLQTMK